MKILCVTAVRNESRYLPGFLRHIRGHVDGVVALDDCSTDDTAALLAADDGVVSILRQEHAGPAHANETDNRFRLLTEAARLGARWVVCADADERFETGFLERLRGEAEAGERSGQIVRYVRLVNLWNSPDHYRIDGISRPRPTVRMFQLPAAFSPRPPALHCPWFPPELDAAPRIEMNAHLYHLRMIRRADREARFAKFCALDPDAQHQSAGYAHMIDETGLTLKTIAPGRGYIDDIDASRSAAESDPVVTNFPAQSEFDERFYLNGNTDVLKAVLAGQLASGWDHFVQSGSDEGRAWRRRLKLTGFDFPDLVATWRRLDAAPAAATR